MPKFKEIVFGKSSKTKQLPTMSPQQESLQNKIIALLSQQGGVGKGFNQALQYYQDLLDPESEAYKAMEAPYMREFQEQTLPGIAEQFAGAGALSSSGFGQALSGAGAGLQERLASLRAMTQQAGAQGLMQSFAPLAGLALGQSPFAYQEQPGHTGLLGGLAGGAANWLSQNYGRR